MPKRDALRRRPARREPKKRFLIVCEGEVTEQRYFEDLRHLERIPIVLDIYPGGDPKALVERAVKMKKDAEREAKSSRDDFQKYDQVWCVFDVDEHPRLLNAKQQAGDNGIELAVSNPCFELWVLLHFQDQRAHIARGKVQSLCRKQMPGYHKELPCAQLMTRYEDALQRARDLEQWHSKRGTDGGNPSTDVHLLVEEIRSHRSTPA